MIIEELTESDNRIYYPCPKSTWTSSLKYTEISRVLMAHGDSSWYEYVERIPFSIVFMDGIHNYKRFDGKEIKLNPRYMVEIEDFIMVTASYYTASQPDHRNKVHYLITDKDQKIELIDEYLDVERW